MLVKFEISLPEKVIGTLGIAESEVGSSFKKELAITYFNRNVLSFGQARQLADMSVWDFIELLRDRRIPLHYDILEYEDDLKTIKEVTHGKRIN